MFIQININCKSHPRRKAGSENHGSHIQDIEDSRVACSYSGNVAVFFCDYQTRIQQMHSDLGSNVEIEARLKYKLGRKSRVYR